MAATLVLLHGFAGTRRSWGPVADRIDPERYRPLALDLRGHGANGDARPITVERCVDDVLAAAPQRFGLCGYSMGGRIALHVALAAPQRIERLILVATTAGIVDDGERAARAAADAALARETAGATIQLFAQRWMGQELFAGTPPAIAELWRADLLRNRVQDLAAVLRGLGAGTLAPVWDRLGELTMPVTVVVGERDARYVATGERLVAALPDARLIALPGAGHGLPREAPAALADAIVGTPR